MANSVGWIGPDYAGSTTTGVGQGVAPRGVDVGAKLDEATLVPVGITAERAQALNGYYNNVLNTTGAIQGGDVGGIKALSGGNLASLFGPNAPNGGDSANPYRLTSGNYPWEQARAPLAETAEAQPTPTPQTNPSPNTQPNATPNTQTNPAGTQSRPPAQTNSAPQQEGAHNGPVRGAGGGAPAQKVGKKGSHTKVHVLFQPLVSAGQVVKPGQTIARFQTRVEKEPAKDEAPQQPAAPVAQGGQTQSSGGGGTSGGSSSGSGGGASAGAGGGGADGAEPVAAAPSEPAGQANSRPTVEGDPQAAAALQQLTGVQTGDEESGFALQNQEGEQSAIPSKGGDAKADREIRMTYVAAPHELQGDGSTLFEFESVDANQGKVHIGFGDDGGDKKAQIAKLEQYLQDNPDAPDKFERQGELNRMRSSSGTETKTG